MTKEELAQELSERSNLQTSQSLNVIQDIVDIISTHLEHGDNIYIRKFGTLKVETRKPRKARDIRNNKSITVGSRRVVKFIMGSNIKERLNS